MQKSSACKSFPHAKASCMHSRVSMGGRREGGPLALWRRLLLWLVLLLALPAAPAAAKVVRGSGHIPAGGGVYYAANFGCAIGTCRWKLRARLRDVGGAPAAAPAAAAPSMLHLRVYLDDVWEGPEMRGRPTCKKSIHSKVTRYVKLPLNGTWGAWDDGDFYQVRRAHVWFFVLEDCEGVVAANAALYGTEGETAKAAGNKAVNFDFEFEAVQQNGSHHSFELLGTAKYAALQAVYYGGLAAFLFARRGGRRAQSRAVLFVTRLLSLCVVSHLAAALLELAHLSAYGRNGVGLPLARLAGDTLTLLSQIIASSALLCIAGGMSLNLPFRSEAPGAARAVLAVVLMHAVLALADAYHSDARFKFHAAGGPYFALVVGLRLLLFGAFLYRTAGTLRRLGGHAKTGLNAELAAFLRRFAAAGSAYFLAFPAVYFVTRNFGAYIQHKVLTAGVFAVQAVALAWLVRMFFARSARFFNVSELRQSYLPGGYLSPTGLQRCD